MAKKKAATAGGDKKEGGLLSVLIAVALTSICSGGIGFVAGTQVIALMSVDRSKPAPVAVAHPIAEDFQVVALPSIVTNLGGGEGGWVRLEAVVLIDGKKSVESDLAARLAQDTTALLRSLSLRQIAGASGFQHLREELMDRMKTRSANRVRDIMIQSLVIE